MNPIYQDDLDALAAHGCQMPGCSHDHDKILYFVARCHPKARISAYYKAGSGVVLLLCGECEKVIVPLAVARGGSLLPASVN